MKLRLLLSFFALVTLAASALPARAGADDTVRACIASSTDGQTLRNGGHLLAARAAMLSCARDACPAVVRSHCARWLGEIEAQIPSVVVRAQDAAGNDVIDARVAIDGRPGRLDGHPVPLDPGDHAIAIDDARGHHVEERVLVVEGESSRLVTLHVPAGDPAADAPRPASADTAARHVPVGAWILGGAGLLALGGSAAFALAAKSDLDGLESTCSPHCTQAQTQPGRTRALVADVLLGGGAAALGGAIVWALAFPSHSPAPRVGIRLVPIAGGAMTTLGVSY